MSIIVIDILAVIALIAALWLAMVAATRILRSPRKVGNSYVGRLEDDTRIAPDGSVLSVQSASVDMETSELDAIWTPTHLGITYSVLSEYSCFLPLFHCVTGRI